MYYQFINLETLKDDIKDNAYSLVSLENHFNFIGIVNLTVILSL